MGLEDQGGFIRSFDGGTCKIERNWACCFCKQMGSRVDWEVFRSTSEVGVIWKFLEGVRKQGWLL